jgi:hypothetical protein
MKRHPAYGLLVGEGANINDCGEMFKSLDAAGVPIFIKGQNTARAVDEVQHLREKSGVPHVTVFRQHGIHDFDRPDYTLTPKEAAAKHLKLHETRFPKNLDWKETWFETTNEIAKQFEFANKAEINVPTDLRRVWEGTNSEGKPTIYVDNSNWMGWFACEISELMLKKGYKHIAFSWNTGEPEAWQWETEGVLAYLRLCEQQHDRLAVGIHEYSGVTEGLLMRVGKGGGREPVKLKDVKRQNIVGRFQNTLVATCSKHNIAIPKFCVTEGGWGYQKINVEHGIDQLKEAGELYFQYEQCLGFAIWGSVPEYGGIANQVQKLFALQNGRPSWLTEFLINTQYEMKYRHVDPITWGGQVKKHQGNSGSDNQADKNKWSKPVTTTQDDEPVTTGAKTEILAHNFALFDRRGEWYDNGNVQIATGWKEWRGSGDSPLGDGKEWNRLVPPEGVYLSEEMLPPQERAVFHNKVQREGVNGFTYHIFGGGPWHDRQWKRAKLDKGTYELQIWLHGDWATGGSSTNKTREGLENRHALAELFVGDKGKEDWLEMDLVGDNRLTKTFKVDKSGEYDVGWGIYTVWANHKGPNGCFIKGFTVNKVGATKTKSTVTTPPPAQQDGDHYTFVSVKASLDTNNAPKNTPFSITWTVQNTGSTTWNDRFHFGYAGVTVPDTKGLSSSEMGGNKWQSLSQVSGKQTVAPGEMVELTQQFTTPTWSAMHASHWRLHNQDSQSFGDTFWVKLNVTG